VLWCVQWERLWLLVTDPALRPKAAWANKVPFKVNQTVLDLRPLDRSVEQMYDCMDVGRC
jgi:hypothetical protein